MAINTLADWRGNGAHARQSILGRPRRKDEGRAPDHEDADEVQRSPATDHHIQTFFTALQDGDEAEQSHALAKIVDAWRADNNAGGLPVYAHLPLPSGFATELAKVVQSGADGKPAADGVVANLEPGARLSVSQQLRGAVSKLSAPLATAQAPSAIRTNATVEHAPTWNPDDGFPANPPPPQPTLWQRLIGNLFGPGVHDSPPPIVQRPWDQELRERGAAGALRRTEQEWKDFWRGLGGGNLSPEEILRRRLMGDVRRRGREPVFLGPKAPHPDDPYKDRVSWPANPNAPFKDVTVNGGFGNRTYKEEVTGRPVDDFHPGVDFRNTLNQPVFSPKNGTILSIVPNTGGGGNVVCILHDDASVSVFLHTGSLSGMQPGDEVYAGQKVGISDDSGKGTPHTHYMYFPPGTPIDPDTGLPMHGADDHRRNAPARTQVDPFGPGGPFHRISPDVPYFVKPDAR